MDANNFFIPTNTIADIPQERYEQIHQYALFLDAFTRTTHKSIYVIDYFKKSFLYVSDNPLFLCGLKADEVKEMGYDFYFNHVPKEEIEILKEINYVGFNFLTKIPKSEILDHTISYDFNLIQKDGRFQRLQLINHQLTPISLTEDGKIWLALCVASISTQTNVGNVEIYNKNISDYWQYSFTSKNWHVVNGFKLKDIEIQILRLSIKGYTMEEIAGKLFKSVDAIKSAKKILFEKLNVSNITEAVSYSMTRRLL